MIWSANSGCVPQTLQIFESRILFRTRLTRHWMRPWVSSQIKNWTLGGARLVQTNLACELANLVLNLENELVMCNSTWSR
jgi:hypothetical protein